MYEDRWPATGLFTADQKWTYADLTGDQDEDGHCDNTDEGVDDDEMDEGEDVQGLVAPAVRVAQGGFELGPVDTQDPQVAEDEPHDQEGCQEEVGDPGACRGGQAVVGRS